MSRAVKRRRKSAAARIRPFSVVFAVLLVAGGIAGYYGATWKGFFPRRVSVTGNRVVPSAYIVARAEIAPHENLWLQNMHAAAGRIAAIPYIRTVAIHRSLPANVRISVVERRPFALVQAGKQRVLVDSQLRVLQAGDRRPMLPVLFANAVLPRVGGFIQDRSVRRLRNDYVTLARGHVAVRALRYDEFGDLVATTPGGIALLLGDDGNLAQKTPLIDPIISQVSATGRKLAAVDLRAPRTPVVVYKK